MKMKAAILHDSGDIRVVALEKPVCGPGDILVKNVRAGICGSDLAAYLLGRGHMGIDPGGQFGHEMAGYITEVGREVKDLMLGMKVFVNPRTACKPGKSNMLGGFSEYIRVASAETGHNVFVLPDDLSWDDAVLIEPFAVGTRGKNVPGAKAGDNVVVYGAGTIGLSCVSSLVAGGIRPVVVVRRNIRRPLLESMGAIVCNTREVDLFAFLKETFGETTHRVGYPAINVDIVVDCAGIPHIIDDFLKMMKPQSRLSIVGFCPQSVSVPLGRLMSSEVIIQGACCYDNDDIFEVIENLKLGRTHMPEIITHHFPLDRIGEAFMMAGNRDEAIKVVIDME